MTMITKVDNYFSAMEKMRKLTNHDPETSHMEADQILCEFLTALGYGELVKIYEELDKWYA